MTHRECFNRVMAGEVTSWVPNYELGCWGQTVERWFRDITDKRIRRGSFKSVPDLIKTIMQYIETNNQNPHVFVWTASVERILTKIAKSKEVLVTLH